MSNANKMNILLFLLVILTFSIVLGAASLVKFSFFKDNTGAHYPTIDCGGSTGKVHKCIRIDPSAGEINDSATGAHYRVIYGT